MKFRINAGLASIQELTPDELDLIFGLLDAVDRQCFPISKRNEESSLWVSDSVLSASLTDAQRSALGNLASRVRDIYKA